MAIQKIDLGRVIPEVKFEEIKEAGSYKLSFTLDDKTITTPNLLVQNDVVGGGVPASFSDPKALDYCLRVFPVGKSYVGRVNIEAETFTNTRLSFQKIYDEEQGKVLFRNIVTKVIPVEEQKSTMSIYDITSKVTLSSLDIFQLFRTDVEEANNQIRPYLQAQSIPEKDYNVVFISSNTQGTAMPYCLMFLDGLWRGVFLPAQYAFSLYTTFNKPYKFLPSKLVGGTAMSEEEALKASFEDDCNTIVTKKQFTLEEITEALNGGSIYNIEYLTSYAFSVPVTYNKIDFSNTANSSPLTAQIKVKSLEGTEEEGLWASWLDLYIELDVKIVTTMTPVYLFAIGTSTEVLCTLQNGKHTYHVKRKYKTIEDAVQAETSGTTKTMYTLIVSTLADPMEANAMYNETKTIPFMLKSSNVHIPYQGVAISNNCFDLYGSRGGGILGGYSLFFINQLHQNTKHTYPKDGNLICETSPTVNDPAKFNTLLLLSKYTDTALAKGLFSLGINMKLDKVQEPYNFLCRIPNRLVVFFETVSSEVKNLKVSYYGEDIGSVDISAYCDKWTSYYVGLFYKTDDPNKIIINIHINGKKALSQEVACNTTQEQRIATVSDATLASMLNFNGVASSLGFGTEINTGVASEYEEGVENIEKAQTSSQQQAIAFLYDVHKWSEVKGGSSNSNDTTKIDGLASAIQNVPKYSTTSSGGFNTLNITYTE